MIKFYCPHCNQKLGVPDEYAGKRVRCSKCQQPSLVPQPQLVGSAAGIEDLLLDETPPPASAPGSPPADTQPDFEDLLDRNAAITAASRDRKREDRVLPPIHKTPSAQTAAVKEVAKGMGKIPLSIGFSILMMAVCIVVWVFVAKITSFIVGFLVLLVPTAGAWGLTFFTEHRGIMLALLAAFMGFGGMVAGKVVLAKWVVYPMLLEEMEDEESEFSKGFNAGLQGLEEASGGQLTPEQIQYHLGEEDIMVMIAAFDIPIERETIKAMYSLDEEIPDEQVDPGIISAFQRSYDRLDSWNPQQQEAALRRHYNAYTSMAMGELLTDTDIGKAVTGFVAFVCSFTLFDLIWFPMGIYGAWKIGNGTND